MKGLLTERDCVLKADTFEDQGGVLVSDEWGNWTLNWWDVLLI